MDFASLTKKLKSLNVKGGSRAAGFTPGIVLPVALLIIVALDVWVAQAALRAVYKYRFTDVGARLVQSTRVNFVGLNKAITRIEDAATYKPAPAPGENPFLPQSRAE